MIVRKLRAAGMAAAVWALACAPALAQKSTRTLDYFDPYVSPDLSRVTVSLGTGVSLFKNDLNGFLEGRYQNNFLNFFGNVGVAYRVTDYVSFQLLGGMYQLYAAPSAKVASQVFLTNPTVKSTNVEGYFALVHDFFSKNSIDHGRRRWNLYAIAGVGFTRFEPVDVATGEKLRPMTEEEAQQYEYPYNHVMPIFPMGLGFSAYLADNQAFSLELCYRLTGSDWMDHAWYRNTFLSRLDGYLLAGVKYHYTFLSNARGGFHYKGYRKRASRGKRR
jgi:hypothetical protein